MNRHSRRRPPGDSRSSGGSAEHAAAESRFVDANASFTVGEPAGLADVAGYRVLRTLSTGERADIVLGRAPHGSTTQPVAVKVFRQGADPTSVEREIAALDACRPGCLPRLIDLGTLMDGRVVIVMERLGGGTLGSLLLRRNDHLEPGEAVTVIAPIVVALAALHAIGFGHSTLSPGTVTFDDHGRPVLTGLGGLRQLPPFGPRATSPGAAGTGRLDLVRDDYARLTVLMRSVFAHLDRATPAARQSEFLAAWFEGATSAVPFQQCLDELERRLFEWAPAVPVRHQRDGGAQSRESPGRVVLPSATEASPAADPDDGQQYGGRAKERRLGRARRLRPWLAVLQVPDDIASPLADALDGSPIAAVVARVRTRIMARRRAMIVAGCVATAATVLALTLLPPADGSPGSGSVDSRTATATAGGQGEEAAEPRVPLDATAQAAVAGDDPVLAVPHLLAARSACRAAAAEEGCFSATDQMGSPIMAADLHHTQIAREGGRPPPRNDYAQHTATLIERTGNSALITLTPGEEEANSRPASLLVIKGEAGWRLREIFEAVDGLD